MSTDDEDRLRAHRLRSKLLSGPAATTPEDVVGRLLAVQAQDELGLRLAVRSRSRGLTSAAVDASFGDGRLPVTWLNRGTLHLVRSGDYRWLHALTAPRVLPRVRRRLRALGVGPDVVVRGPMVDGRHAFVAAERWVGPPSGSVDRDESLVRLARRYLDGHAPAGPEDLAAWAGITRGDARRAFGVAGVGPGRPTVRSSSLPAPRLLGPFDPLLHGWASRAPFVGSHAVVVTGNGIFRPTLLVGGRAVGTWRAPSTGIVVNLLEDVDDAARAALESDARRVERYLGRASRPVAWTGS